MVAELDETRWFAAIWRDGEPARWELRPFAEADLELAARHARDAGFQWSHTFLLQVLAGPTPAGHRMIEQLADGGALRPLDGGALEVELRRQIAELQTKLRDNELAAEAGNLGRESAHFDPRAVAKGMFPTHIGPGGAHFSDGTVLSPSVVEDFERFKQVADARALLKANDWVEGDPGEWFPASSLRIPSRASSWAGEAWAINVDMCSPAILRALAILAEEVQL